MVGNPGVHVAACSCCRLDLEPWELTVLSHDAREVDDFAVSALLTVSDVGVEPSLTVALRHGNRMFLVLPRAAVSRNPKLAGRTLTSWVALRLPAEAPGAAVCTVCESLKEGGFEVLRISPPAVGTMSRGGSCSSTCRSGSSNRRGEIRSTASWALLEADRLPEACRLLEVLGFALGPADRLLRLPGASQHLPISLGHGAWVSSSSGDTEGQLPQAIRFEASHGVGTLFVDVRVSISAQADTSRGGPCIVPGDSEGLQACLPPLVSLRPQRPWSEDSVEESPWMQIAAGSSVALELLSQKPGDPCGYWIFATGGLFARIYGLPVGAGLVGGYCCQDAEHLSHACGDSTTAELQTQFEAMLGKVERPGLLRVLRRSWAPYASGSTFYDAESCIGGHIEVDRDAGLVVHRLPGGGEQRWRIIEMSADPFTPPGGASAEELLGVDDLEDLVEDLVRPSPPSPSRSSSRSIRESDEAEDRNATLSDDILHNVADLNNKNARGTLDAAIKVFNQQLAIVQMSHTADGRKSERSRNGRHTKESPKGSRSRSCRRGAQGKARDKVEEANQKNRKDTDREHFKGRDRDAARSRDSDGRKELIKEKDRGKDKRKDGVNDHERDQDIDKDRYRKLGRVRDKDQDQHKDKEKHKERGERERERERARDRDREKERGRDTGGDWDREREKLRATARAKDRERERGRDDGKKDKHRARSASLTAHRGKRSAKLDGFDKKEPQGNIAAITVYRAPPAAQPAALQQAALLLASFQAEPSVEVEAFLAVNPVEAHAAARLRALPNPLQWMVFERGSLQGARDPSAVLISRVRDAMLQGAATLGIIGVPAAALINGVHPGVEMLIVRHSLDSQCAHALRNLPLPLQAVAAELPVQEARNPSAFVMAQLQQPRFRQQAQVPNGILPLKALPAILVA